MNKITSARVVRERKGCCFDAKIWVSYVKCDECFNENKCGGKYGYFSDEVRLADADAFIKRHEQKCKRKSNHIVEQHEKVEPTKAEPIKTSTESEIYIRIEPVDPEPIPAPKIKGWTAGDNFIMEIDSDKDTINIQGKEMWVTFDGDYNTKHYIYKTLDEAVTAFKARNK